VITDFFTGSPFVVELEKDLSLKKQLLDVIIVRRFPGSFTKPMPEGLEELAAHNLITFKSHQEALDDWALKELTGHYVNYRKQVSPSLDKLLPEDDFRCFAVCVRFPHKLAQRVTLRPVRPGVYDVEGFGLSVRVIVVRSVERHGKQLPLLDGVDWTFQVFLTNRVDDADDIADGHADHHRLR